MICSAAVSQQAEHPRNLRTEREYARETDDLSRSPPYLLTWPVGLRNRHVHHSASILRFRGRRSESADPRFGRGTGGQTVRVFVRPCRQLLGGRVRYEALCDGELGMPQLFFHLGMFVGPGQFFVGRGGTFCGDHAAPGSVCTMGGRKERE